MKLGSLKHEYQSRKRHLDCSIESYLLCRLYKVVTNCQKEVLDFLTPSSAMVPEGTNAHFSDKKIWDYVLTLKSGNASGWKNQSSQKIKQCAGNYINVADISNLHHPFDFVNPLYLCWWSQDLSCIKKSQCHHSVHCSMIKADYVSISWAYYGSSRDNCMKKNSTDTYIRKG